TREPAYLQAVRSFTLANVSDTKDPVADLKKLLGWPTIASKHWVYRQYDHTVRDNSVVRPGSDAAVLRIKPDCLPAETAARASGSQSASFSVGTADAPDGGKLDAGETPIVAGRTTTLPGGHSAFREKFIALTVDCNATYVYLDPYEGSKIAVAEAARNLACSGALPLGTTDNLNFGNPHN